MNGIIPQGMAVKADILGEDTLIEVYGEDVEETVERVKTWRSHDTFLRWVKPLMGSITSRRYNLREKMASLNLLPHLPQVVEMKKGSIAYGFI